MCFPLQLPEEVERVRMNSGGEEEIPALIQQCLSFAYNDPPFSNVSYNSDTMDPLEWWKILGADSNAFLISVFSS